MIRYINIHNFRLLNNIDFYLGKNVTVISGQNATGKSTVLGLLGATAELKTQLGTPILKKQFRSEFSEMFTASPDKDLSISKMMTLNICEANNWDSVTDTVTCRTGWWTNPVRYRIIPKRVLGNKKTTEAKISWPTLYLGLSRLYPVGESEQLTSKKFRTALSDAERLEIGQLYSSILFQQEPVTDIIGINPSEAKRKLGIGTNTPKYDYLCNSAGQDNLGQILLAILSFKKLKNKMGANWNGGLLLIDEFDATLHSASQIKLFEHILHQSADLGIQVVFTTHSLYLLEHITKITKNNIPGKNNDVELVFFTTGNRTLERLINPDFNTILYDLNMKLKVEKTERIKIYCEDKEARHFAAILLEEFADKVRFVNFNSGCDQLLALYKSDDYFKENVVIFTDGDFYSKYDNLIGSDLKAKDVVILLPLRGLSPEKTIYEYIFSESPSGNLISCFDPSQGQNIRNLKEGHPLITDNGLKEREQYKKWYEKLQREQPSLFKRIILSWILDHPIEYNKFLESFKKSFNIIVHRNNIVAR